MAAPKRMPTRQHIRGMLNAMRAKIHIAKKDLGLTDDDYRAMLLLTVGKQSSKGMSYADLNKVLTLLQVKYGWKPKKGAKKSANPSSRKIWALWLALYDAKVVETKSCLSFVKRQSGRDHPDFLSPAESNLVIEALKSWAKREGVEVF